LSDFGLASNRRWSRDGNSQEETVFVDCTLWGKRAESLSEHLTKGKKVSVDGRLKLNAWNDSEGIKRSKLSIVAEQVNFLEQGSPSKNKSQQQYQNKEEDNHVPFEMNEPVVDFNGDL
jgi:single-strand DNA-binding protein